MIGDVVDTLHQHREKVRLLSYFILMLVLMPSLGRLFGAAYENGHVSRAFLDLRHLVDIIDLEGVSVFFLGIFLGLLVLMTIDPKKRWQGYLLWIGLAIAMLGLQSMGLFIPNIEFTDTANLGWLGVGVVLGFLAGGGRQLLQAETARAREFRRASFGIYVMVVVLILGSLVEYHVLYPEFIEISSEGLVVFAVDNPDVGVETDGLLFNLGVAAVVLVTVRQFIQYDAKEDFFVLGPPASGKSLFLIGSYLAALNRNPNDEATNNTPLQPSQDLMEMVENLDRRSSGWIVDATGQGEIKDLEFQYVHGSTFPKNVKIASIDYAGEYLSRLPDVLAGAVTEEDTDNTLLRLAGGVESADTLILLVDTERHVNGEGLDIKEYFSILQSVDDTSVFVVATKADILADRFREEEGIEAHLAFDEFKSYVSRELRQSEQVESLIRQTTSTEIHPVYYQTRVNDDGDRVPMRDETGSVMTIGFDQLLEELGR
ncbi:hypothetical protein D8Y22_06985 [Salinadaptatus halalkaliphilus]|uniref:Uncharacterized protein n=1 Tax=Salinadaptatus halalkaliphilus TaxID=2419781 RepID=A0A4S3TQJ0_9EURY|nr:acyltransferase [Salinadaptatus halalkaliphilus]THE65553.1 hypothetical protein D8Y22_06985 [Salinadaptatus halalkaliphilus]